MAEAIFAGENVEKLALEKIPAGFAFFFAELTRFAENLFLRNRPRNRSDRD